MALYDTIGHGYREMRRADPRIGAFVTEALGDARSVVNVGAGAGSYEPTDRRVVAVEPSQVMIDQRPAGDARVVRASGSALPFADRSFDASLAILTIHHWPDVEAGLRELKRVARDRVVLFTFDADVHRFWLYDYFPEIRAIDQASMPPIEHVMRVLDTDHLIEVPVPHDCSDGFLGAYWRRPEAYLDPDVRASISVFPKMDSVDEGIAQLAGDLESGAWARRYGELRTKSSLDVGYRLVVA